MASQVTSAALIHKAVDKCQKSGSQQQPPTGRLDTYEIQIPSIDVWEAEGKTLANLAEDLEMHEEIGARATRLRRELAQKGLTAHG